MEKHITDYFFSFSPANTERAFITSIKQFEEFAGISVEKYLTNPDKKVIHDFVNHLKVSVRLSTIHQRLLLVGRYAQFVIDNDYVLPLNNPFTAVKRWLPKDKNRIRPTQLVPLDTVVNLIETASTPQYRAMLALSFYCGLRISELIALDRNDIKDNVLIIRTPKSQKMQKQMIPPLALMYLDSYLSTRADKLKPLFITPLRKTRMSIKTYYRYYKAHCHQAPHSARATATTLLKTQGVSDRATADFLRHSSMKDLSTYDKREDVASNISKLLIYPNETQQ